MKRIIYIITHILLIVILAACEDKIEIYSYGTIDGKVLDGNTYLPVQGVQITTSPASNVILSDKDGAFTLSKIKEGETTVTVQKKDYLNSTFTVTVYGNESTHMNILINKDEDNIGNITFSNPEPANGAVIDTSVVTLKWKVGNNKTNSELTYDIYLFKSNSTVQNLLGEGITISQVITSKLNPGITYYWYVVAKYKGIQIANSPTWSFMTQNSD